MIRISYFTIIFVLFSAPVVQACEFCQQQVTLSKSLAKCYLSVYEDEILRMNDSGLPAQLINLAVCDGVTGIKRGTETLPTQPSSQQKITTSFLLDEDGLVCLARELKSENWPSETESQADPIKTFEVKREC